MACIGNTGTSTEIIQSSPASYRLLLKAQSKLDGLPIAIADGSEGTVTEVTSSNTASSRLLLKAQLKIEQLEAMGC